MPAMGHSDYKGSKRIVFRIQLTPESKRRLTNMSDNSGITQVTIASRLVEWFASQPEVVQNAVLGLYPDLIQKDVANLIVGRGLQKPSNGRG